VKAAFVLLSAVIALSARGEDVAAHYVLRGVTEVGSELLLKSDGTFEYILAYGAADYWAKGTWRQENNRVFLNSAGRKEAPFRLLRSEAGEPGKIRVWVIGKNGHAVENVVYCYLLPATPLSYSNSAAGTPHQSQTPAISPFTGGLSGSDD
jgi:hypothetical protein